jgi:hypothetical protein
MAAGLWLNEGGRKAANQRLHFGICLFRVNGEEAQGRGDDVSIFEPEIGDGQRVDIENYNRDL